MRLPLFPLSSHLLPEGRLALRIFEPRYTRMVKEACGQQTGFVICMLNPDGDKTQNTHIFKKGTYCEVIDFDILNDGLLGITVEGKGCVQIGDISTEHDGLRMAECRRTPLWSDCGTVFDYERISERLQEVFEKYSDVNSLYENAHKFEDYEWVINRWIELLPLAAEQKQHFMNLGSSAKVAEYLNELIE
ncbi:MAG: LON peptidase substrate-binding domain-containing protein [Pseudomonadota bacterium]